MTVIGTVCGGKIELPPEVSLPDGTKVQVEVCDQTPDPATAKTELGRQLLELAGTCDGLPEDLSVNLDHYLYGTPKR